MKRNLIIILGFISISVGLYPLVYLWADDNFGLLNTKSAGLLSDIFWRIPFYGHIFPGGIALSIGWIQFSTYILNKRPEIHKLTGKIYLISMLISGFSALILSPNATGGWVAATGFASLGILWISFSVAAYRQILKKNVLKHKQYMIYSYSMCLGAVTLRIWLPLLSGITGSFTTAYLIVAWLSWVPNLLVAWYIVERADLD